MAKCERREIPEFVLVLSEQELNAVLCGLAGKTSPIAEAVYVAGYNALYRGYGVTLGGRDGQV